MAVKCWADCFSTARGYMRVRGRSSATAGAIYLSAVGRSRRAPEAGAQRQRCMMPKEVRIMPDKLAALRHLLAARAMAPPTSVPLCPPTQ